MPLESSTPQAKIPSQSSKQKLWKLIKDWALWILLLWTLSGAGLYVESSQFKDIVHDTILPFIKKNVVRVLEGVWQWASTLKG
jgi:hypothetical protein